MVGQLRVRRSCGLAAGSVLSGFGVGFLEATCVEQPADNNENSEHVGNDDDQVQHRDLPAHWLPRSGSLKTEPTDGTICATYGLVSDVVSGMLPLADRNPRADHTFAGGS